MSRLDQDVANVFERFSEAWRRGDAAALASLFEPHASFVNIAAQRARGRHDIEAMHEAGFQAGLKGTRLHVTSIDARELAAGVCIALVGWQLMAADAVEPFRTGIITAALTRGLGGDWTVAAAQNTQAAAPAS